MKTVSLGDRLRYRVDNAIAKGPSVLIYWLLGGLALLIVAAALVVYFDHLAPLEDGGTHPSFWRVLWASLIHFLDNGNFSGDNPRNNVPYIASMGFVTLLGIGFSAVLTGILTNAISSRLEAMRKGRSTVAVRDHTVILGWSPHLYTAVEELLEAHRPHPGHTLAVLAPKDKVEMEDRLRERVGALGQTRLVCRSGLPMDMNDLAIANPFSARAVIVLSSAPEDSISDPDAEVIKTVLALTNFPGRPAGTPLHIVAELRDRRNLEAAQLAGGDEAQFVLADEVIARITAQTCRQSGLSVVLGELLSFQGNEIYFATLPTLVGQSFGEAQFNVQQGLLIGLRHAGGRIELCPDPQTKVKPGDQAIVIAEDDTRIHTRSGGVQFNLKHLSKRQRPEPCPEANLILGWNSRGATIVEELERMVAPGSRLTVLARPEQQAEIEALRPLLRRQRLELRLGVPTDTEVLGALEPAQYGHVITLGDTRQSSDPTAVQAADAHTLVTLLHLRKINARLKAPFAVVSEMLDPRNRELAEVAKADDFIVSDRLVSLVVTQIAENPELAQVWGELLDADGVTAYLRPAGEYILPGQPVDFFTVMEAARRRGEVAIGYRLKAEANDAKRNYGVHLNPDKATTMQYRDCDKIILMGRLETAQPTQATAQRRDLNTAHAELHPMPSAQSA